MPHGEHDLESAFQDIFEKEGHTLPPSFTEALAKGLVKAVEFATTNATSNLTNVYQKKTVRNTAIITALVVLAISIPVTYLLSTENVNSIKHLAKQSAHAEILSNCEAQAKSRPQGNARAIIEEIELELAELAFAQFPDQFRKIEIKRINEKIKKERPFIPGQFGKPVKSFHDLQNEIKPVKLINCKELLG